MFSYSTEKNSHVRDMYSLLGSKTNEGFDFGAKLSNLEQPHLENGNHLARKHFPVTKFSSESFLSSSQDSQFDVLTTDMALLMNTKMSPHANIPPRHDEYLSDKGL